MESTLRLRLVFEDSKVLSESQRSHGLKRSWVSVNQTLETISDLAHHISRVFELRHSRSHAFVLSIDGFTLPPFESTSILKEDDVIRVKRRRGCSDTALLADGGKCFELEGVETEERRAVDGGMKLLANEEFEKESGGYRSESEEGELEKSEDIDETPQKKKEKKNKVSKKRKASKKLDGSNDRKKRKKSTATEEPEQNGGSRENILLLENGKSSDTNNEVAHSSDSDSDGKKKNVGISTPTDKSPDGIQENGKSNGGSSSLPDGSKKTPSRSTRRRKLKREWLRAQKLGEKQLVKPDDRQSSGKDNGNSVEENQLPDGRKAVKENPKPDEWDDDDGDVVPVVVRPGYIRFEPYGKEDDSQKIQQRETAMENFQWNGITNKRKGQQWGKEKTESNKRSDKKNRNVDPSDIPVVEEGTTLNAPIEFDKLSPCIVLPQEGDTLAYRLIELSSSWTPEVSSFRVGKVSKFDPNSDRLTLVQVPEYPISLDQNGDELDESVAKSNISVYADDGSLEIDYPSLYDVRIIKRGNINTAKKPKSYVISRATAASQGASSSSSSWPNLNNGPKTRKEGASSSWPSWPDSNNKPKGKQPSSTTLENGKVTSWDEICATLSAKKTELAKEDSWSKKSSTSQTSWSHRGLRGSAMGPMMARLRAQNEL